LRDLHTAYIMADVVHELRRRKIVAQEPVKDPSLEVHEISRPDSTPGEFTLTNFPLLVSLKCYFNYLMSIAALLLNS